MRLFAAVLLPDEWVRDVTLFRRILERRYPTGISWIPPESLHMTVRFFGSVEESVANSIISSWRTSRIVLPSSITLELDRCGCYPEFGPERIVWVGAREVSGLWSELVAHLDAFLAELGMVQAPLRDDLPHITVGRVRQARLVRGLREDVAELRVQSIPLRISNVVLLSSVLTPAGAMYREEARMAVVANTL